jgi:uncharacterized protein (DUF58 family)
MIRLTGRGVAVLVAAVVLFAVGQWLGYPVLLVLAAVGLGAVLASVLIGTHRPRVTVSREVYPDRVPRGGAAFARLRVHNPGTRWQVGFTAGDWVGPRFRQVVVRSLRGGATADYSYELPTAQRGRYEVGPLTLDRVDALGLGRSRLTTGDTATLWVHPRTLPMRAMVSGRLSYHYDGRPSSSPLRGSMDLREVREYVPGDEVRHLHWKATARTGRLMVRDYVDPNQPRLTVLLDTRAELMPAPVFEDAVDVAASLIVSAAQADHGCRLLTTGETDIAVAPGARSAGRQLLDELCQVNQDTGADQALLPTGLAGGDGGGLVVVLSAMSAADRAALVAARRQFASVVVIMVGGAERVALPGVIVLTASTAAEAVGKWNTVIAR